MYPITTRRWFFPAVLFAAIFLEFFGLRATWRTDIQHDSKLSELQVRSGYELVFQGQPSKDAQPILSYDANARHNHRLTLTMESAQLSEQSRALLSRANPPTRPGPLIYAPNPSESEPQGPPCLMTFRLEFPEDADAKARAVEIIPPTRDDVFDPSTTRLIHLKSAEPLLVRVSTNSESGANGPGCRNLLSIGPWQGVIGKDFEVAFLSDPGRSIMITLSSPSFESGKNEIESLEIQHLLPLALMTRPAGVERIIQSRQFAGEPPLTLMDLRLGKDFFDVELAGKAAVPLSEMLGWMKWPILASVDLPILMVAVFAFTLKKTIFLSYSWGDEKEVFAICERMKPAGLEVWIDRQRLRGGDDWEERIRSEMLKCRCVVAFLSHFTNEGGFFLAELALARAIANDRFRRRNFVIPVRLEKVPIPSILGKWNAIDLFEPDGERKLFDLLGAKQGTRAESIHR